MSVTAFHQAFQGLLTPSSDFKASIGGRFRYAGDIQAQAVTLPYAAWLTVYCEPRDEFGAAVHERMVQVDIYAASMAEAVAVADKARALFGGATAVVTGMRPMTFQAGSIIGPMREEAEWRVTLELVALTEES